MSETYLYTECKYYIYIISQTFLSRDIILDKYQVFYGEKFQKYNNNKRILFVS